jgi:GTPase
MFIDEVVVEVEGGRGGHGMASFRREKYVEYGGPWGGNGGDGGAVIFIGDEGAQTLLDLRYKRHLRATHGENGRSKGMHGKNATHLMVRVPLGTIVKTLDLKTVIGEITQHEQTLVVAKGGRGGRGNISLATSRNNAPNYAEKGDPGENLKIHVELKVLADVGLIGYPSVGKSTIISVLSNARPKIAEYPFTTLQPNLGMVEHNDRSFVLADLPGLIENAHQGLGLGIRFLKHIERCRVFLHVVALDREDPYDDYIKINYELEQYDESLLVRPQIIVMNKMDIEGADEKIEAFRNKVINREIYVISAIQKKGLTQLLNRIFQVLDEIPKTESKQEEVQSYIYEPRVAPFEIQFLDGVYHLSGEGLKKIFERTDFTKDEAVRKFARQLRGMGIDDALREKGCRHGDRVKIFEFEFEFIDG